MGYSTGDMIRGVGEQVGRFAGEEVRERVMAGAQTLTGKTKAEQTTLWMKECRFRITLGPAVQ